MANWPFCFWTCGEAAQHSGSIQQSKTASHYPVPKEKKSMNKWPGPYSPLTGRISNDPKTSTRFHYLSTVQFYGQTFVKGLQAFGVHVMFKP